MVLIGPPRAICDFLQDLVVGLVEIHNWICEHRKFRSDYVRVFGIEGRVNTKAEPPENFAETHLCRG